MEHLFIQEHLFLVDTLWERMTKVWDAKRNGNHVSGLPGPLCLWRDTPGTFGGCSNENTTPQLKTVLNGVEFSSI